MEIMTRNVPAVRKDVWNFWQLITSMAAETRTDESWDCEAEATVLSAFYGKLDFQQGTGSCVTTVTILWGQLVTVHI